MPRRCCAKKPKTPPAVPCTVNLNVEGCTGVGISGVSVNLTAAGTSLVTGTTDGSGNYSHTFTTGGCADSVTVSYAGKVNTQGLVYVSGVATVAVMYGTGTVTGQVVDYDSGAIIASQTTTIEHLGAILAPDGTGGIPLGGWGIGGWVGPGLVPYSGADYYPICYGGPWTVYCGDSRTITLKACSSANWNMQPCQKCGTDGVKRVGAIPKTLHTTFNGPGATLGTDDGRAIAIDWDASSWNGDVRYPLYVSGFPAPMRYGASLGPNGSTYNCFGTPLGVQDYIGATVLLVSSPHCLSLSYTLVQSPCTDAFGTHQDHQPPNPGYCPTPDGAGYYGIYPSYLIYYTGDFTAPVNVDMPSVPIRDTTGAIVGSSQGWNSVCKNPYDPSTGASADTLLTE